MIIAIPLVYCSSFNATTTCKLIDFIFTHNCRCWKLLWCWRWANRKNITIGYCIYRCYWCARANSYWRCLITSRAACSHACESVCLCECVCVCSWISFFPPEFDLNYYNIQEQPPAITLKNKDKESNQLMYECVEKSKRSLSLSLQII